MLRLVAGTVLFLLIGLTEALAVEEIKKDTIGPWEIEATFKDNKFDHCAISRKVDEIVASFLRTSEGLSLTLQSPNWKLEQGKNYPVRMKAGAASWNTDVAAETNSVSVPISDKKSKEGLRAASVVAVEGAGATIRIPLDQSRAALDRLEQCANSATLTFPPRRTPAENASSDYSWHAGSIASQSLARLRRRKVTLNERLAGAENLINHLLTITVSRLQVIR